MKTLPKYEQGLVQGFATTISYMLSVLTGDIQVAVMTIEDGMRKFAKWEELVKYCPEELKRWGEERSPYSNTGTFADWYRFFICMGIDQHHEDFQLLSQIMQPFSAIYEWNTELSDQWLKDYKDIKNGKPVDGIKYYFVGEYKNIKKYGFDDFGQRFFKGNNYIYIKDSGEIVYGTSERLDVCRMRFDLIEDLFRDGVVELRRE